MLKHREGHEDSVHALAHEVVDVAVHKLGGEADVVRHHFAGTLLVVGEIGHLREHHLHSALGEQRMPEGKVLIHVQTARNAYGQSAGGLLFRRAAVKEQRCLALIHVHAALGFSPLVVEHLLTAVAREEHAVVGEAVAGHGALVDAAVAVELARGVAGVAYHRIEAEGLVGVHAQGVERAAYGPHQFGTVAAEDRGAGEQFQRAHDGVVAHGSSLHHNLSAQLFDALQPQHLVEAVLHHRVGQSGGYVVHLRALAQHLLHLRVHKHGAAGAKVAGVAGAACGLRKVVHRGVERAGESADERAAARRTGLVHLYPVDDSPVGEDGLHVLSADVEYERHVAGDVARGHVVGHGLDDARAHAEGGLDEVLAVAGARPHHLQFAAGLPAAGLQLPQPLGHGPNGIALVVVIIVEHHLSLSVERHYLCGGRTAVDAHHHPHPPLLEPCGGHGVAVLAGLPLPILFGRIEERLQLGILESLPMLRLST